MKLTKNGWYRTRGGDRVYVLRAMQHDEHFPWMLVRRSGSTDCITSTGKYAPIRDADWDVLSAEPPECDSFDWVPPKKTNAEILADLLFSNGFSVNFVAVERIASGLFAAIKERDK